MFPIIVTSLDSTDNKHDLIHCEFIIIQFFSSPGQRRCELLSSFGIRRPSVHPIFSSETVNQIKPNLAGMVPGWVPFKIVSDSSTLHSIWLLLLKIEISSIVDCCFIINLNELKCLLHYMEMSSLTYILGFSVKFFFQPIFTDYAN